MKSYATIRVRSDVKSELDIISKRLQKSRTQTLKSLVTVYKTFEEMKKL